MNLIGSVMVSVLASSVVDREFEPQRLKNSSYCLVGSELG